MLHNFVFFHKIEPVGNKTVGWELGGDLKCPNEVNFCI